MEFGCCKFVVISHGLINELMMLFPCWFNSSINSNQSGLAILFDQQTQRILAYSDVLHAEVGVLE